MSQGNEEEANDSLKMVESQLKEFHNDFGACLAAYDLHTLRTIALYRMWSDARLTIANSEDVCILEEIRHQLQLALSETVYHKCMKAVAVAEVAGLVESEENPSSQSDTG